MYPALAVAAALGERAEVLWVGAESGMEESLVRQAGLAFEAIPAAGVHGVGARALPGNLLRVLRGVIAARRVLRRFQPQALFFTGGYVGVPVALAGWRLPKAVFVPDVEPGLALRMMIRLADTITVSSEAGRGFLPSGRRVVVTGYPTRPELQPMPRARARARLGIDAAGSVLLVFGGSRGARSINQALWAALGDLLPHAQVLHITGELDWPRVEAVRAALPEALAGRYHPYRYLHGEEMAAALSAADLALSRAGASTLGEFPLFGLPAVLVPYPYAWRYQKVNAEYLVGRGAAQMLEDGHLQAELLPTVLALLQDPQRLERMADAARSLACPGAAAAIAAEIVRLVQGKGGAHA